MKRCAALLGWFTPVIVHAQIRVDPVPAPATVPMPDRAGDRSRALGCLATAIAYEAAYEPIEGQQAVAEVILNRLRHSAFPKTVCGVVFAGSQRRTGCQFSFTCDGSLNRKMPDAVMTNIRLIAAGALDGRNPMRVRGATHYHADYVSPYWAPSLIRIAKIGAHIFYRGAGARDQKTEMQRYEPFGEPLIDQVETGSLSAASSAHKGTSTLPPGALRQPPAFAPWGLAPPMSINPPG